MANYFDLPKDFEKVLQREGRQERVSKHWECLVNDEAPDVDKSVLNQLMKDLKDEGNMFFKEELYDLAWMHYRNALFVGRILESRHKSNLDPDFVSSLFSNRAFCCLKKKLYKEAIQDSEKAIAISPNNIKAYYRKILALKGLEKWTEALSVAELANEKQTSHVFTELIAELRTKIPALSGASSNNAQTKSTSDSKTLTSDSPDPGWLADTNVGTAKMNDKKKKEKNQDKSGGRPDSQLQQPSNGNISQEDSDSAESVDSLMEDGNFAQQFINVKTGNGVVGKAKAKAKPKPRKVVKMDAMSSDSSLSQSSMGLDNFGFKTATKTERSSPAVWSPCHKANRESEVDSALPKVTFQELTTLEFPAKDHDFMLACNMCFVKTGEGKSGFQYRQLQHTCPKDVLLVKPVAKYTSYSQQWTKVRQRPENRSGNLIRYILCKQFAQGLACNVGEASCTFAHNQVEIRLWDMDQRGAFSINNFITRMRELSIGSLEEFMALREKVYQTSRTKTDGSSGIPGLHYKQAKSSQQAVGEQQNAQQTYIPVGTAKSQGTSDGLIPDSQTTVAADVYQGYTTAFGANFPAPYMKMPNAGHPPPMGFAAPVTFVTKTLEDVHEMYPYLKNLKENDKSDVNSSHHKDSHTQSTSVPYSTYCIPLPTASKLLSPNTMTSSPKVGAEQPSDQAFPLNATHDYKLVCRFCFQYKHSPGCYCLVPKPHKCDQDILAVARKGTQQWVRIRERKNHRPFPGKYQLCHCIMYRNPAFCRQGEENCSFAHSVEEQQLWTLEKDENFAIMDFVMQNRSSQDARWYTVMDAFRRHGGNLMFICKDCFIKSKRITSSFTGDICDGEGQHIWSKRRTLAHEYSDGTLNLINNRGFLHKTAFFKICKFQHYCQRLNTDCKFAHSMVERDIWMVERDTDMSRDDMVKKWSQMLQKEPGFSGHFSKSGSPFAQNSSGEPGRVWTNHTATADTKSKTKSLDVDDNDDDDDSCPIITAICETCWKNGKRSGQDGSKNQCVKMHANWQTNHSFLLATSNKVLRPLPRKIPSGFHFVMCRYLQEGSRCGYRGPGHCQFAHSQEELEVWQWMCIHEVNTLEELYQKSQVAQKERAAKSKGGSIAGGESVVTTSKKDIRLPTQVTFNPLYCEYCSKHCNSNKQWEEHCATEKHRFNVNSDKEHQWNCRQPPWGLLETQYRLCYNHMSGKLCQYSQSDDMYNLCRYAHSQEELDEWRERFQWRSMKREMAKQEQMFSYMDQLLDTYESSNNSVNVISEQVSGVEVACNNNLVLYEQKKNTACLWTFKIKTGKILQKAALLFNKDRLHFAFKGENIEAKSQIINGDACKVNNKPGYEVTVTFQASMFGTFQQWLILDFGEKPVLARKISVEIGSRETHQKVKDLRTQLKIDRWTPENRKIMFYEPDYWTDDLYKKLGSQYKAPQSSDNVINQDMLKPLNRNNYTHKMRKMLELEEITRQQIIDSYNMCTKINLLERIEESNLIAAQGGELFAKVPLNENLTEDTNAGKLIYMSVKRVLFAPSTAKDKMVYEALIVGRENFNFESRGKEHLYLCFSAKCVQELKLKAGKSIEVEIQFQMDRNHFCRMQFAVDQLTTTDVVFPDISKLRPLCNERHDIKISSKVLNPVQMQAVKHIVAQRTGYTAPFVIYGPFGTGKTETLAQAAMVLLRERPGTRLLICTQSNSAADLYILNHLASFIKKNAKMSMLRILFKERRPDTVPPEVKKFCLLSASRQTFEMPSKEDILRQNVVIVTLATSLWLACLDLKGHFTHIFIDEAAQALEAETILPLTLASEKTCMVLAGDHHQISQKVYSEEAKRQKFDLSLLERLYDYYDKHSANISPENPLNIPLTINYRSKKEIVSFLSTLFYGGPNKLESQANLPSVLTVTPLTFYAVQGREVQDADKVTFYNFAELEEIVERVEELFNEWPKEWGPRKAENIVVVSPYYEQVQLIRRALRKRKKELAGIVVENVTNMQGREFRALFLSTVRTRSLLETPNVTLQSAWTNDFGFLSNPKLLNTALTRAQSFVGVVGDPVALCAIGQCMGIWRQYLKTCEASQSLHPRDLTVAKLKQQVTDLLNTTMAKERVQELAKQQEILNKENTENTDGLSFFYRPEIAKTTVQEAKPEVKKIVISSPVKSSTISSSFSAALKMPQTNPLVIPSLGSLPNLSQIPKPSPSKMGATVKPAGSHYDGASNRYTLELKSLAKPMLSQETSGSVDKIQLSLVKGMVVLTHADSKMNVEVVPPSPSYSMQELLHLAQNEPNRYHVCTMKVHSQSDCVAEAQVQASSVGLFHIGSEGHRGPAFHLDQVLIEMLQNQANDPRVHGQVVGIFRRHLDMDNHDFVCSPEPGNVSVMVPLNAGISRIRTIVSPAHMDKVSQGHVSVYRLGPSGVQFHTFVDVTGPVQNNLFVVRYMKWEPSISSHVGLVVGSLAPGTTFENCVSALNIDCAAPDKKFPVVVEEEVKNEVSAQMSREDLHDREDLRDRWTFAIGCNSGRESNMAISIDQSTENYLVGLHLVDVDHYVTKDSRTDAEARKRGCSSPCQDWTMLPKRLLDGPCCLKTGKDCCTISLLVTMTTDCEVKAVKVVKSVVNVKSTFTDKEVQEALADPDTTSDYIKSCLYVLYHLAINHRKQRLGNLMNYLSMDTWQKQTSDAQILQQELELLADKEVGRLLLRSYPKTTPLLCQPAPHPQVLELWRKQFAADAVNSLALTKAFLENMSVCHCKLVCTCIMNHIRRLKDKPRDPFVIKRDQWEALCEAIAHDLAPYAQNIITSAENHPQLTQALLNWKKVLQPEIFKCINAGDHYTFNMHSIVKVSDPLGCYIDLVALRMLKASINNQECPYVESELQDLCHKMAATKTECERMEANMNLMQLSEALKTCPLVVQLVAMEINQSELVLAFSSGGSLTVWQQIQLCDLLPFHVARAGDGGMEISWHRRIYDLAPSKQVNDIKTEVQKLNSNRFVCHIPAFQWQKLLSSIREEKMEKLKAAILSVRPQVKFPSDAGCCGELTLEARVEGKLQHFTQFSLSVHVGDVLQVQMSSQLINGMPEPTIQTLNLATNCDMCVEHARAPEHVYFNNSVSVSVVGKQSYMDEREYVFAWKPLLQMELAARCVKSPSIVIRNVPVSWLPSSGITAVIQLDITFVMERFLLPADFNMMDLISDPTGNPPLFKAAIQDLLCIRDLPAPEDVSVPDRLAFLWGHAPGTWTAHCSITNMEIKDGFLIIFASLQHSSIEFPSSFLSQSHSFKCTLEWMPVSIKDRFMSYALESLENSTLLSKQIALGNPVNGPVDVNEKLLQHSLPGLPPLSDSQFYAAVKACKAAFTVINGVAGSGKSFLSAYLTGMFYKLNKSQSSGSVLLCAPSEDSLDVLTDYLLASEEFSSDMIRVYGEDIERQDFPLPMSTGKSLVSHKVREEHKFLALHHLVREDAHTGQSLQEYDLLFSMYPDDITLEQVEEYRCTLTSAKSNHLQRASIVLCTLETAAHVILMEKHFKQVVIDDCSMVTELEAMIPITLTKTLQQGVVLGDSAQDPIQLASSIAAHAGLKNSLVSRYKNTAIQLSKHYRMHDSMAAVLGNTFYNQPLQSCMKEQSSALRPLDLFPKGSAFPVVMCNVIGTEVESHSNHVLSYNNEEESNIVVATVVKLRDKYKISDSRIAVITDYMSHVNLIQRKLQELGINGVQVLTVSSAVGKEWEIVVVSTVRSMPSESAELLPSEAWLQKCLGSMSNPTNVHISLTRARNGLIVVGNAKLLRSCALWRKFINMLEKQDSVISADQFNTRIAA